MGKGNLSVVLATFNEEENLSACLETVKDIADELIIVDGSSTDKTVEIAKRYGAKLLVKDNPPIFHINKQKALEMAIGTWILQLDADERVSKELAKEIKKVIAMTDDELEIYENNLPSRHLFLRHKELLERRDGTIGEKNGQYVAFFIPRLNYFLGKYLRYGGVYPDGVIRLVKNGYAHFPCVSVHEQIAVNGRAGWLENPLYHRDSPTFKRYIARNNRYINLMIKELEEQKLPNNLSSALQYLLVKPIWWFVMAFGRHKGFLDGWQGFVFAFFSARRFPVAYVCYIKTLKGK